MIADPGLDASGDRAPLNHPAGVLLPHASHPGSGGQFAQQRLGVFKIGGVEAFSEPVVDLGEHRAGLIAAALVRHQSGEAHGCAEFENPGTLPTGNLDRGA